MRTVMRCLLLVLCGLGTTPSGWSCTCGAWPSAADAWAGSPVVFAGLVQRVAPDTGSALDLDYGPQTAWVLAEEPFKGVQAKEVLVLQQPGHGCSPKFRPGEKYVFYLFPGMAKSTWVARGCHRTRDISRAADDLLFLRALPQSAEQTRLSGTLHTYEDSPTDGFRVAGAVPGALVTITGAGQSLTTTTNADGVYEVYGLPAGEYKVQPEIPRGLRLQFPMPSGVRSRLYAPEPTVVLEVRKGVSVDFVLAADTRIAGRVRDPQGEPMKNVCIELESTSSKPTTSRRIFSCTEKDGTYKLEMMPPGEYRVVVNKSGLVTASSPFPKLYAPGTTDIRNARIVTILNGDVHERVDIQIPSLAKRVRLSGRLTFLDGSPASHQIVRFRSAQNSQGKEVPTWRDGAFDFLVIAGQPGELLGEMIVTESDLKRCPQIPAKLAPYGLVAFVHTPSASISGEADQSGIVLTFPFRPCERLDVQ